MIESSQSAPSGREKSPAKSRRRLVWFAGLSVALLLAVAAGRRWLSPPNPGELPEIPAVNLEDADPEVVRLVHMARAKVEQEPNSATAWGDYAMLLHFNGFSQDARICYASAATLDPKNPLWPYLHGYLDFFGPNGPTTALPLFELAASLSPPRSMARMRLADALFELGRLDEAENEYRKFMSADDEFAVLGLANIALARRQYDVAVKILETHSAGPCTRRQACAMKAIAYDRLGDYAAAEREREKQAELPEDELLRADDPALLAGKKSVGVNVELAKAMTHLENDRLEETVSVLKATARRYPNSYDVWEALGKTYKIAGDPAAAEQAIEKSIELAPQNSHAWLNLGNLLIWQSRHREAMAPIQKAIAMDSQNASAWFSLGECRREAKDRTGALEAYREAIRLNPKNELAKQRLEELGKSPHDEGTDE